MFLGKFFRRSRRDARHQDWHYLVKSISGNVAKPGVNLIKLLQV